MNIKMWLALLILLICLRYTFAKSKKLRKMTVPGFTRYYGIFYKIQTDRTTTNIVKKRIRTEPFRQNPKGKMLQILIKLLRLVGILLYISAVLVNLKNLSLFFGLMGFSVLLITPSSLLAIVVTHNYWASKSSALPKIAIPTKTTHATEMKIRYQMSGYALIVSLAWIFVLF